MSHIVQIKTQVRDAAAVQAACQRLGLAPPVQQTIQLFSEQVTGLAVQLADWRCPIVCDLASGAVKFDNYEGRWGEQRHLDAFLQGYAAEKAKLEARRRGHSMIEQPLADGSIKLTITVGGST